MAVTVLVVDDHPTFRATARMLLEVEGYDVVGEAKDGHEAIAQSDLLHPDLVLLDVNLPDMDGFQVASRLTARDRATAVPTVILISSRESSDFGSQVTSSGARGFIAKADLSGDALAALLP